MPSTTTSSSGTRDTCFRADSGASRLIVVIYPIGESLCGLLGAVNSWEYFVTLLRYIHQNPVAGGLALRVKDYPWSSWSEYEHLSSCPMPFCAVSSVLSRISLEELTELVNEPMPKTSRILDYNNEMPMRLSEDKIREFISKDCGIQNPKDLQSYSKQERKAILKEILAFGGSIKQISRITGISESIVRRSRK